MCGYEFMWKAIVTTGGRAGGDQDKGAGRESQHLSGAELQHEAGGGGGRGKTKTPCR